jgi:hypothetical protein
MYGGGGGTAPGDSGGGACARPQTEQNCASDPISEPQYWQNIISQPAYGITGLDVPDIVSVNSLPVKPGVLEAIVFKVPAALELTPGGLFKVILYYPEVTIEGEDP